MTTSSARKQALDAIKVGDVIFCVGANGDGQLMLVYRADRSRFFARHITTQTRAEFGSDGKSRPIPTVSGWTVASTAPLPAGMYEVAIGLDHKMGTAKQLSDLQLSSAEKTLLLTFDEFFETRLLPD